jgi:hypothetical protein
MKYMLFAWADYEANGGMNDFRGLFNSVKEAEKHYTQIPAWPKSKLCDYGKGQIYCATSLQKVKDL